MKTEAETNHDTSCSATNVADPDNVLFYPVENPLKESRRRKLLRSVFGKTSKSPFCWGLKSSNDKESTSKLIGRIHRQFWNSKTVSHPAVENLLQLAGGLDSDQQLLAACALCGYRTDLAVVMPQQLQHQDSGLSKQLQIELGLWSQLNVEPDALETEAVEQFERLTDELLDGDGWPEAKVFHDFGLLAASWLRCAVLFDQLGMAIDAAAESRLDWMCRQLLRSMRLDGSLFLDFHHAGVNCKAFAKALAELSLDNSIRKMFLRQTSSTKTGSTKVRGLPNPTSVSEWAQSGVLRRDWELGSPAVGLLFGHSKIDMELAHKYSIVAGNCTPNIWINGQLLQPSSEICVTCDLRFDDVDLLELEVEYEDWKLQRQLLMLQDGLVVVSDNVLGKDHSNIEYRCELPLAADVHAVEETSTTEIYIRNGNSYNLVLPLALPEWRAERTEDRFLAQEGRLILTQSIQGQCLSAPLLFDMKPKRSLKPRTWRNLTVAENLEIVKQEIAVAYRVQIGKEQWLFYRALARKGNRTFLGVNVADEFFVGRIDLKGNIESLAEVE